MRNKFGYFLAFLFVGIILMIVNWYRMNTNNEITFSAIKIVDEIEVKENNESFFIPTIYRGNCKVLSIDSLKNLSSTNTFINGLPKLLHYISNEEDIAKVYTPMYTNCGKINNDMIVVLWTDDSFYKVFITQFSSDIVKKWGSIYSHLDDPLRMSMIRSMVINLFGGVVLSLDTVCQKPIRNIFSTKPFQNSSCFVSVGNAMRSIIEFDKDFIYGESVIGCKAKHPFFNKLIKNEMSLEFNRNYFTEYFDLNKKINKRFEVNILDSNVAEQLFPKLEMEKLCGKSLNGLKQKLVCKSINTVVSNASRSMMYHMPNYGISYAQIVADDICFAGIPVHIVII